MKEFCIKTLLQTRYYNTYIYEKIKNVIYKIGGKVAVADFDNENVLNIAIDDMNINKITNLLRIYICDVICEKMKFDYLLEHIHCIQSKSDLFVPFVKVCTYFDNELERQIVMRNLTQIDNIMLNSYLDFRLKQLKNKWSELCSLTNSNPEIFFESATFLELMQFLLSNLENKCDSLIINFKDSNIYFQDKDKILICYTIFKANNIDILSKLIELNPSSIILKDPNVCLPIVETIVQLFNSRVKIVKN